LNLGHSIKLVTDHIDSMFAKTLANERRPRRKAESERETHKGVDVVLYFFSPHRCKEIDMRFLSKLRGRASILPILAKADTMTTDELASHRQRVSDALEKSKIDTVCPPIAVICSPAGANPRGRTYPWGVARSEDGVHSELPLLRRFLLIDGLLPLKAASARHYEMYRSRSLFGVKALLKALLTPVQLLLVSMAAPPPRRWARSQKRAMFAWVQSLRSAREATAAGATSAAAAAVLPKRAGRLTLSQAIRERSRTSRRAGDAEE
jgi:septin family protein